MIFRRSKKTVKKGARGMDKLVTGIIIGGAAASIFGLSRTRKGKKLTERMMSHSGEYLKGCVSLFGKATVKLLSLFQKKK